MENLNFEKRSTNILKAKDFTIGMEVVGKMTGHRDRQITDRVSGEIKTVKDLLFTNLETGDTFGIPENVGLRVALADARVTEGEIVKIKRLEMGENAHGQPLNQYEVLVAKQ